MITQKSNHVICKKMTKLDSCKRHVQ